MSAKRISNSAEKRKKSEPSKETANTAISGLDIKAILKNYPAELPVYIIARKPHVLAEGAD